MLPAMVDRALRAARWLFVVLASAQVSCVTCAADCVETAVVSFRPPIRQPGDYRIRLATTSGGSASTCMLTIPSSGRPEYDCPMLLDLWDDGHFVEFAGVRVWGAPSQIDVLVEKDGEVLADATLSPAYQESSTCGNECLSSNTPLVLRNDV